jgi:hypothetical protein
MTTPPDPESPLSSEDVLRLAAWHEALDDVKTLRARVIARIRRVLRQDAATTGGQHASGSGPHFPSQARLPNPAVDSDRNP